MDGWVHRWMNRWIGGLYVVDNACNEDTLFFHFYRLRPHVILSISLPISFCFRQPKKVSGRVGGDENGILVQELTCRIFKLL